MGRRGRLYRRITFPSKTSNGNKERLFFLIPFPWLLKQRQRFHVLAVDDREDCPELLHQKHNEIEVNLIITGMTGYDLFQRIKGASSFEDIPVVIMSPEKMPSRINRCLEGGAEEFFLKPLGLSDMKRLRPHILKGKSKEGTSKSRRSGSCNKRKAMDEESAQERRRLTYNNTMQIILDAFLLSSI